MHLKCFCFVLILTLTSAGAEKRHKKKSETQLVISKLTNRLEELESYVKKQDEQIKELEGKLMRKVVKDKARGVRAASTSPQHVAFSAYLDHKVSGVRIDQIIKFDKLLLNDGGGYNNITGIFTVPVSGVYLFTYMVNTWVDAYQLVVKLVVDGVNESDGTSDPFHNSQELQGGNTVILRVNKGQSVWLAAYNTGNTMVDGRENYRFSTLSGVLLYE